MNEFKGRSRVKKTFAIISHPDAGKTTLTENYYTSVERLEKLVLLKVRKQGNSLQVTG